MDGAIATNLKLLGSLFDDRMNRLHRGAATAEKSNAETEAVKTYVLEWTEYSTSERELRPALRAVFSKPPTESFKSLRVDFSGNDPLLQVTARYRGKRLSAYVDYRDRRFLRLHSTTQSDLLDDLVQGWTAKTPELDHAWFDDGFLQRCSTLGDFRGIGVEFNNAPLTEGDSDASDEERSESIRLRQSGRAQAMLDLLQTSSSFSEQSSLSMVRVKYPRSSADRLVTTEVRFDGRISGRGNSFVRHSEISEKIIDWYRARVLEVERRYSMSAASLSSGYRVGGGPFRIHLAPVLEDLAVFCHRLFAAINPFRLAGVPRRVGPEHFVVNAVDLHTVQTLRFELKRDSIWVFLPAGTCGNTLLRFVTNLQRHHSRLVRATDF
jgi:hypothetical protein